MVRQTPPDEQDPVSNVAGQTQGRFLRSAVRQASFRLFPPSRLAPDKHDDAVSLSRPSWLAANEQGVVAASPCTRALVVRMHEYAFETPPVCTYVAVFFGMWLYVHVHI